MILTSDKIRRPKGEVHKNIIKRSGQAQLAYSVSAHTRQVGGSVFLHLTILTSYNIQ